MPRLNTKSGRLRIIGGRLRGQRIDFLPETGARPTSDRIRETLFNWLQMDIAGSHCLDLFSGSGALAIEALSRGAASVVLVDQDLRVIQQLKKNIERLGLSKQASVHWGDAREFIHQYHDQAFDIAFLDPSFREQRMTDDCAALKRHGLLQPRALVYMELAATAEAPALPSDWQQLRAKKSGQVCYYLGQNNGQLEP